MIIIAIMNKGFGFGRGHGRGIDQENQPVIHVNGCRGLGRGNHIPSTHSFPDELSIYSTRTLTGSENLEAPKTESVGSDSIKPILDKQNKRMYTEPDSTTDSDLKPLTKKPYKRVLNLKQFMRQKQKSASKCGVERYGSNSTHHNCNSEDISKCLVWHGIEK